MFTQFYSVFVSLIYLRKNNNFRNRRELYTTVDKMHAVDNNVLLEEENKKKWKKRKLKMYTTN